MSQADARSFVDRIPANQQLGQELSELSERADVSPDQLVELGARQGLTFTATELAEVVSERRKAGQELGDAELDAVSGGAGETMQEFALKLQMILDSQSKADSSASNLLKKFSETSGAIISNLK